MKLYEIRRDIARHGDQRRFAFAGLITSPLVLQLRTGAISQTRTMTAFLIYENRNFRFFHTSNSEDINK